MRRRLRRPRSVSVSAEMDCLGDDDAVGGRKDMVMLVSVGLLLLVERICWGRQVLLLFASGAAGEGARRVMAGKVLVLVR
jgi:hypothetical protein